MNFTINTAVKYDVDNKIVLVNINPEILKDFFHTFPEIEIVEESVGTTIIQTYYHISSQNIRKFKLLNIDNQDDNILKLFKILYDKKLVNNHGDNKPVIWWSNACGTQGTSGTSGSIGTTGKQTFKKITKKFDPHKAKKCLKMKKRFKI